MSLDWFRRHQKHFLAGLAVFLMVAWGMGGSLDYLVGKKQAGKVFGRRVSMAEISAMYDRWGRCEEGGRYRKGISRADMWTNYILLHEAEREGLHVSKGEIQLALDSDQRFMDRGAFSPRAYAAFLQQRSLSEAQFEETLEEQIRIYKLLSLITESTKISAEEAWERYASENDRVKVKYVALNAMALFPDISITPEETTAFYEAHKSQFPDLAEGKPGYKREESAQFEYLVVRKADLVKPAEVTEEAIRNYYEAHKETYKIEEKAPEKSDEKAKADAKAPKDDKAKGDGKPAKDEKAKAPAYRPLADVKEEIRKQIAEDAAQTRLNAILEKVDRKVEEKMEQEFSFREIEEALADKAIGYVKTAFLTRRDIGILPGPIDFEKDVVDSGERIPSAIQDCGEGKFIYQVLAVKPTEVAPLEEARKQVEADLKRDKAMKKTLELAEECRSKAASFDECVKMVREKLGAKGSAVAVAESAFFTPPAAFRFAGAEKHQFDTGIPGDHPKFAEEAFRLVEGRTGLAMEEGETPICYLMTLVGREAANRAAFEKEKPQLLQQYLYEKMFTVRRAWVDDLKKRAKLEPTGFR